MIQILQISSLVTYRAYTLTATCIEILQINNHDVNPADEQLSVELALRNSEDNERLGGGTTWWNRDCNLPESRAIVCAWGSNAVHTHCLHHGCDWQHSKPSNQTGVA